MFKWWSDLTFVRPLPWSIAFARVWKRLKGWKKNPPFTFKQIPRFFSLSHPSLTWRRPLLCWTEKKVPTERGRKADWRRIEIHLACSYATFNVDRCLLVLLLLKENETKILWIIVTVRLKQCYSEVQSGKNLRFLKAIHVRKSIRTNYKNRLQTLVEIIKNIFHFGNKSKPALLHFFLVYLNHSTKDAKH